MKIIHYLFVTAAAACLVLTPPVPAHGKWIVGWLEKVRIYPGDVVIHAKLDTGAKNSSLNAAHIIEFERNGERWVRFDLTGRYGNTVTIERKVHRVTKIKQHDAGPQRRFSIKLGICLGSLYKEVEVNLVDRGDFLYQMLIGRSFMRGDLIVDPSAKFTTKPNCRDVPQQ